ncbi:MAG TPA: hypothetical protein VHC86_10330 [Opitutaceae bacterium]|nr:hypothetical protein [Opitutaceae bacterium]
MKDHSAFDPNSAEERAALFAGIREVYPELNDGILEAALRAARDGSAPHSRVFWALKIVRIATDAHRAGGHAPLQPAPVGGPSSA